MSDLMRPQELRDRVMTWALGEIRSGLLPPKADVILEALITRGELDQAEVDALTDTSSGSAEQLSTTLIESGVAKADTLHSRLRLSFPVRLKDQLLPGIFLMYQAGHTISEV